MTETYCSCKEEHATEGGREGGEESGWEGRGGKRFEKADVVGVLKHLEDRLCENVWTKTRLLLLRRAERAERAESRR